MDKPLVVAGLLTSCVLGRRYATMLVRQLMKGSTSVSTHRQRTHDAATAAVAATTNGTGLGVVSGNSPIVAEASLSSGAPVTAAEPAS